MHFIAQFPTVKGTLKWWDVTVAAMPGPTETFTVLSRDINDQHVAKLEERVGYERLRAIMGSNTDVLWDIDLQNDRVWWNEGLQQTFGYGPEQVGQTTKWCHEHIHPEDRARVVNSMTTAVNDGSMACEAEFRYLTAAGDYLEIYDRGAIIRDIDGKALHFVGVMRDVTARNAASTMQKLVAGEMVHRVNNILAVVIGLFHQTARTSETVQQLATTFNGRLLAMAAANTLVIRSSGEKVLLGDLVAVQLAPFLEATRISADGPVVMLPTTYAQPIALALNELATNALKYGALSTAAGVVDLRWDVMGEPTDRHLSIYWIELGGPRVEPPVRKGVGSTLIERGLPNATIERRFEPHGLTCIIDLAI
jgi:PAS domain S-box-containing protein